MSKIQFKTYLHSELLEGEIEENLSFQEGLENHPDLPIIARAVANYTYEVAIKMEWDDENKKLTVLGVE